MGYLGKLAQLIKTLALDKSIQDNFIIDASTTAQAVPFKFMRSICILKQKISFEI